MAWRYNVQATACFLSRAQQRPPPQKRFVGRFEGGYQDDNDGHNHIHSGPRGRQRCGGFDRDDQGNGGQDDLGNRDNGGCDF